MSVGTGSLCSQIEWLQADGGNVVGHARDIRASRLNNTRRDARD